MSYTILHMTKPHLQFEEVEVLTPEGSGRIAGKHKWLPVTVWFKHGEQVFNLHKGTTKRFTLTFTSGDETWTLQGCTLVSRSVKSPDEFVVEYDHASLQVNT